MNRLAEVTNRTILQGLKRRLDDAKTSWIEELRCVLWSYRTTSQKAIDKSPFSLSFGVEAVVPMELGSPSARRIGFYPENNDKIM